MSLALQTLAHAASTPLWSLVIYAGVDEPEIAEHVEPLIKQWLNMPLPPEVELILQVDTDKEDGTFRFVRREGRTHRFSFPEVESADPKAFADFLNWASQESRASHRLLAVVAHSWGWKGIIQDFTIPGNDELDTMMPLRSFSAALKNSLLHPDILLLDACVLGNAEPLTEFIGTAPYLVVSQRETPYMGFPFQSLVPLLQDQSVDAREISRRMPDLYVRAFGKGGKLADKEGEYGVVTAATVDLSRWEAFTALFARFVGVLANTDFRARLQANPRLFSGVADIDTNVDLIEFLKRVSNSDLDDQARGAAQYLLQTIGYPSDVDQASSGFYQLQPTEGSEVKIRIEADPHFEGSALQTQLIARWKEANQDLPTPPKIRFSVEEAGRKSWFVVRASLDAPFAFRPWLAGVRRVQVGVRKQGDWDVRELVRADDVFSVQSFPASSYLIAEAHTSGAPFIHGIGLNIRPDMDEKEERAVDPVTGLKGPDFYRTLEWNRRTGWGNLIFLH